MHYYTDSGIIFPNKIKAIEYQKKTKQEVYFYYHDDVYNNINWSYDPPESLDILYKHQAQRIRDKYDYVVLLYSGGYDSHNVLETFHFNNIKIDKIVITGSFSQDDGKKTNINHNIEAYKTAFPYIEELGYTNITQVIDQSKYYGDMSNFSIKQYGEDWIENIGTRFSPTHYFFKDLEKFVDIPKEFENKKIAFVWGHDKPQLDYKKDPSNTLYFKFRDTVINGYGKFNQTFRKDINNVFFYWDPTYPFILQKQMNILKNVWLVSPIKFNRMMTEQNITKLIYNFKKPILFKALKSPTALIARRDNFLLSHKDSEIYKFYQLGLKKLANLPEVNSPISSKHYIIHKD